jgi:cbb3-type cytochrome oxidase maturation protein
MEALYLLIPISVLIVFIALWVFFKASDDGQFDDLVGPGLRVLQDDDRAADDNTPPQSVVEADVGVAAAAPTAVQAASGGKAVGPDTRYLTQSTRK